MAESRHVSRKASMANIHVSALTEQEINDIHEASLAILRDTGVLVHHEEMLKLLGQAGATVDATNKIVRLPERLVLDSVAQAGKQYTLYGRDPARVARYGQGDFLLLSSPGQYAWIDIETGQRRPATTQDVRDAIRLGDALDNITIVGAMAQPEEVSERYRDVFLTGELVKGTTKPTRCWVRNGATARYILEIYRTVAGGEEALRARPMVEAFIEPISPLQLPRDGLDIVKEFAQAGQPVSIGPMAMVSGTGPGTLAGTLAQENAEILAAVVITQALAPGTPITYGGIPHIMDPRTGICSFGSPEQGLMAVAMVQMGRFYGFPVYINVGLTDAKTLDAQAGGEKAATMVLGALAGADTFGHAGICGTDHAASLEWLLADHETMAYVKRVARGFDVTPETLATEVVQSVGPAGSFMAEEHTVRHFRDELWLPGAAWTRQNWDAWADEGRRTMGDRLRDEVSRHLTEHTPDPIDEKLATEIDGIVEVARHQLS
ncbi:MAG: trimethylamine methyltransferase family protein [Phycisphaerales bacterium]|nr:MAG: trimethylamine methyltransferase family protein [Phycisphaerales bacterium]